MTNPWNLTERQAEAMDAIVTTGSQKGAARALNLTAQRVRVLTLEAKRAMKLQQTLHAALEWDRWKRSQEGQGA